MALSPEDLKSAAADPIPGDSPAGRDVRLEPDFASLQAEIDKLSSLSGAQGGVNWPLAESLAARILKESSKDILAAAYLAAAVCENGGPGAVADGAGFLADFLEAWWPRLFPPLKRFRARANAVEWWRDKAVQLIGRYQGPPLPRAAVDRVAAAAERLDKVLAAADGNLPSVRDIVRNLAALPVEAAPAGAAAPPAGPAPAPEGPASAPGGEAPAAAAAPPGGESPAEAPERAAPAPAAAAPAGAGPAAPPPKAQPGEGPDSPGAAQALRAVSDAADSWLSYCPQGFRIPRYWELSRLRLWLQVAGPPPAENGRTRLLPPPPEILANLKSLLAGGSFQEALAAAEDQTGLYVFWLDLHRISGKALEGLGLAACASALLLRAAAFRAAIPQIASLAFEDGTPFCSRETMDWLDSAGGGSGPAPSETARYDRFLEGDPAKSLSELGESAERPSTGRDGMLARAAEMLLYQRTGRAVEAAALARWAVGECGRLELAAYDPDCAARAMSSAACVLKGAGAEFKADYLKALEALARCGPRAVSGIPPAEIL